MGMPLASSLATHLFDGRMQRWTQHSPKLAMEVCMNDIGHDPLRRAAPAAWYINSGLRLSDEEPDADIEPKRYALVPALERLSGERALR